MLNKPYPERFEEKIINELETVEEEEDEVQNKTFGELLRFHKEMLVRCKEQCRSKLQRIFRYATCK